jgi:hypothetical protein
MEGRESECSDPRLGAEIERISNTGDLNELVDYYHNDPAEPSFLSQPRQHWSACAFCRTEFPDAMDRLASIQKGAAERALQEIELLSAQYASEFSPTPTSGDEDRQHVDRLAALASTFSAPVNWQLSFLLPNPSSWTEFTVLSDPGEPGKKRQITACSQHLEALAPETRQFVFVAVLAGELYLDLYNKYWRMQLPTLIGKELSSGGLESIDNPEYPIYQAYEIRASLLPKFAGRDCEMEPLYGSPILLDFIRENLRDTLLETPLDYRLLHSVLEQSAAVYLQQYERNGGELGNHPVASQPGLSAPLHEISSDLNDGIDSLRAGQMEIRLAIDRLWRPAATYLPLIESRLGGVYGRLHQTTKRLLALGEYFRSINQAEPDAMNDVVLNHAKACEHELYMRIVGPYILRLLGDGVLDYLYEGDCTAPLLKQGKEVIRSMTLGTYARYLKYDSKLREWVKSTLNIPLPALIDEAYWISDQRNLAAHNKDYKQYDMAIFQQRLFSRNGLLNCLHPGM